MNCKICGAELKKPGELCNNCMNKLMKDQEIRNDKKEYYTFKKTFALGYELLRKIEQIGILILLIALLLSVDIGFWPYTLALGVAYFLWLTLDMLYLRASINRGVCTLYRTKLVYKEGIFRKKVVEIPYSDVEEIYYSVGNMQRVFHMGTIVIKRKTRNILQRNFFIEPVKNIETVFGKIEELLK